MGRFWNCFIVFFLSATDLAQLFRQVCPCFLGLLLSIRVKICCEMESTEFMRLILVKWIIAFCQSLFLSYLSTLPIFFSPIVNKVGLIKIGFNISKKTALKEVYLTLGADKASRRQINNRCRLVNTDKIFFFNCVRNDTSRHKTQQPRPCPWQSALV